MRTFDPVQILFKGKQAKFIQHQSSTSRKIVQFDFHDLLRRKNSCWKDRKMFIENSEDASIFRTKVKNSLTDFPIDEQEENYLNSICFQADWNWLKENERVFKQVTSVRALVVAKNRLPSFFDVLVAIRQTTITFSQHSHE